MLEEVKDPSPINTISTIGFAQLAITFPFQEVSKSLQRFNRLSYRMRMSLNEFIFYVPIMMALENVSAEKAYESIQKGSSMIWGSRALGDIGRGGLANARLRVGVEPFEDMFLRFCHPLATDRHPTTHLEGMRMVAIDGCLLNVADTAKNAVFGRPKNQNQKAAGYPQARIVALVETGTHAFFGLKIDTSHVGETTMAKGLLETLQPDMLVMADRLYLGWDLVNVVTRKKANLIWRAKAGCIDRFKILARCSDGSYKASYIPPEAHAGDEAIDVRIVAYQLKAESAPSEEPVYLVTTLLDPEIFPAQKLITAYMQRWEIEMAFGEMKCEIADNEPLWAQRPELVKQQIFSIVLAHYAVRKAIYQAARTANLDPDIISFKGALETIKTNCKMFSFSDSFRQQLDDELCSTLKDQIDTTTRQLEKELNASGLLELRGRSFIQEIVSAVGDKLLVLSTTARKTVNDFFSKQAQRILDTINQELAFKPSNRVSSSRGKSSPRNTKQRTNRKYGVRKQKNPPKVKYGFNPRILLLEKVPGLP